MGTDEHILELDQNDPLVMAGSGVRISTTVQFVKLIIYLRLDTFQASLYSLVAYSHFRWAPNVYFMTFWLRALLRI